MLLLNSNSLKCLITFVNAATVYFNIATSTNFISLTFFVALRVKNKLGGHAYTIDARNVLIFGADMSFSLHATNRAKHIYLMSTDLTQDINDTTIYAEKT